MTYDTSDLPLGSKDPRVLYENAEHLDLAMNSLNQDRWMDRGPQRPPVARWTWWGIEQYVMQWLAAQGFEPTPLEYVDGSPLIVDRPTQLIQRDGNLYSVQLPADFPVSLSGNWATDEPLLVNQVDRALRAELVNETDLALGAAVVGRSAVVVESLADLVGSPRKTTHTYHVRGHRPGITTGGGVFVWDPLMPRSMHNGGTVISPTVPAYTAQPGLADYLAGVGETEPSASGAFVRRIENNTVRLEYFGWVEGELGTAPLAMLLRETRSNEGDGANIGAVAMLPPGTVRTGPVTLGSNQIIGGTSRTIILQEPGTVVGDVQPFLTAAGQVNLMIMGNGMQVNGQKNEATSGEGRYGIFLYGAKKVLIQDVTVNSFSGDGLALTGNVSAPCEDVRLERVTCNFNGRNAFSVINAKRATLVNCRGTNTNTNGIGASANGPWAGFDIEPNEGSGYFLEDINLIGCSSEGNAGCGLQFTIPNSNSPVTVRVYGFQSRRDGSGTQYGGKCGGIGFIYGGGIAPSVNMNGHISIINPYIDEPFGSGIRFRNWSAKNVPVSIHRATVRNVNYGAATGNINRCGLWIDSSDASDVLETKGNFELDGLMCYDDNAQLVRPVWALGTTSAPVVARIREVYVNRHGYPAVNPIRAKVLGGVSWNEPPVISLATAPTTLGYEYAGQVIDITAAGGFTLPEASLTTGMRYCIRNSSGGSVTVTTAGGTISGSTYATYTNTGTTLTLTTGQYAEIWSNGTAWILK
ncbi:TPA: right-handed parallel beta-helix repeat-containing protein [Pseudomonas aeruginosa]|uniref:right-handed parallel beta-helix repeat-containing protein n=1 Tax=Pseudomonas aeruginosa TaxID=287 RepID=UPI000B25F0B3|nr:right-handed parallel beta-helix repeat-containing protein [Pseudomonas aeruginosa]EKW9681637.1 right-handed parallel beta-helix repeat-containing protein [Pseudomonas aeruginosa]ELI8871818.1 right-handed parallel beta-helix repeat-containing protein [Pseudomonas aeruginosa]MBH4299417.1 right-handed parallel beta-helix repeat-containing protein [Pseudomonas aeruginosa]MCT1109119.1 right-handed parallel beta-helix repeat-containing protein [Pseudomonas aeruginosa]NPX83291.1 right-handed para